MVTPSAILRLARQLAETSDEASLRAAVSRAYYAAFLHHRELAQAAGLLPIGYVPAVHNRVENALRASDPPAADGLHDLRLLRNRADYDIADRFPVGISVYSIYLAGQLIDR